ncbi:oxidoreductase, short chain dehydrogenase/reductase family protein, partial [Ancylostoma duodenale]
LEPYIISVVLVTGASGYVGLHCVQQLLAAGYKVRGTVSPLLHLPHANERLELIEADLMNEEDWPRAVAGCTFILHVASPWPIVADESTIKTAVDGTLHVLRAASMEPSVRKVVLTSSCSAVNDGHPNNSRVFDETCWTDLDSPN